MNVSSVQQQTIMFLTQPAKDLGGVETRVTGCMTEKSCSDCMQTWAHLASYSMSTRGVGVWRVKVDCHLHFVPRLRAPSFAFMACKESTLPIASLYAVWEGHCSNFNSVISFLTIVEVGVLIFMVDYLVVVLSVKYMHLFDNTVTCKKVLS